MAGIFKMPVIYITVSVTITYLFEIGGKNKKATQIKTEANAFVVADDIELGIGKQIPLWLFGFLY